MTDPMTTHWFGPAWPYPDRPAPVCDPETHIDTPIGERCLSCEESILDGESGVRTPLLDLTDWRWAYTHVECWLRTIMCPIEMGLLPGPHVHDPAKRREEGRVLMEWARR